MDYLQFPQDDEISHPPFDLMRPASHCTNCNAVIHPYQNIPIFSYLALRGRCANCQTHISARYPIVEALAGLTSAVVAWHFGFGLQTLAALIFTWGLISTSLIDLDHQLLPDSITLPLLWLALFNSLFDLFTNSQSSIIGAIAGYMSLWSVYKIFKLVTGKEGMGFGDFKLLSMLGAWMGWAMLPLIILLSSLVGATVGIMLIVFSKHRRSK